jgi:hypothetical protein
MAVNKNPCTIIGFLPAFVSCDRIAAERVRFGRDTGAGTHEDEGRPVFRIGLTSAMAGFTSEMMGMEGHTFTDVSGRGLGSSGKM